MAIIGYIPPAAEPIPAVNAQPVPDNAPPAEARWNCRSPK